MFLRKSFFIMIFILSLMIMVNATALAYDVNLFKEITSKMVCLCGCGKQKIYECECQEAENIRNEVKKMLNEGKTEAEILSYYVKRDGQERLAAPTAKGFNFLAWIMPGIGLIAGGLFVNYFIRKKQNSGNNLMPKINDNNDKDSLNNLELKEIEEELKKYL
ncbi:cytochrome C domain-containing protein [Carboxydothermus islandicus]|uniref:Cytochrome c-type biogenesis protein n=1 Tax=Carboxydothermus islandicus TaxID=661089 RepID=A0A1L8D3U8_9THEO|nr:cytochrome c-type biogenesis protein CcmH [Carboxydothermus islandicus]GAV25843.1 cytochrome C domain-containing protein [Carboxydothermus islandicus]